MKSSVGGYGREEASCATQVQQTSGSRHVRLAQLETQNAVLDAYGLAREIVPICVAPIFRRRVYGVHFARQQPRIHEREPAAATPIPSEGVAISKFKIKVRLKPFAEAQGTLVVRFCEHQRIIPFLRLQMPWPGCDLAYLNLHALSRSELSNSSNPKSAVRRRKTG